MNTTTYVLIYIGLLATMYFVKHFFASKGDGLIEQDSNLTMLINFANMAVHAVEQTMSGSEGKEKQREAVRQVIALITKLTGLQVDDDMITVIESAVEQAVFIMNLELKG